MRAVIVAYIIVQSFGIILFFGTAPFLHSPSLKPDESKQIVDLLLPVFSGQLGCILGFYFGSKKTES
jgi:hypothetical protein